MSVSQVPLDIRQGDADTGAMPQTSTLIPAGQGTIDIVVPSDVAAQMTVNPDTVTSGWASPLCACHQGWDHVAGFLLCHLTPIGVDPARHIADAWFQHSTGYGVLITEKYRRMNAGDRNFYVYKQVSTCGHVV